MKCNCITHRSKIYYHQILLNGQLQFTHMSRHVFHSSIPAILPPSNMMQATRFMRRPKAFYSYHNDDNLVFGIRPSPAVEKNTQSIEITRRNIRQQVSRLLGDRYYCINVKLGFSNFKKRQYKECIATVTITYTSDNNESDTLVHVRRANEFSDEAVLDACVVALSLLAQMSPGNMMFRMSTLVTSYNSENDLICDD